MRTIPQRVRASIGVALVALVALAVNAAPASAKSEVLEFSSTPSTTQAGGHPNILTITNVSNRLGGVQVPCECNDPKNIHIHAPAGLIANPHVVSICSSVDLAAFTCPADSQVGFVVIKIFSYAALPLYRVTPQAGQASLFAFTLPGGSAIAEYLSVTSRTGGDYGLDFKFDGIDHAIPTGKTSVVFWGVPGAKSHDVMRFAPHEKLIACTTDPTERLLEDVIPADCLEEEEGFQGPKPAVTSSLPVEPFTQNPTTCVGPLKSTIDVLAYDEESDSGEAPWPATTGCDKLSFSPSLAAAPTTTETDSASGLAVDLKVPQYEDPETPSPSELKGATLTLPPGFSINANAADGKTACSDAAANFGNEEAAQCPEFSKIGTTVLDSSALPGPIDGYIYLGEPQPGNRYRILLTASGFATNVKIFGSIHPDPQSGQLVTSFENLPQSPFQEFNLHFFGSERGVLATPTQCGTYPVETTFVPWASELSEQTSTQFFQLTSGPGGKPCPDGPRPFSPGLAAGSEDNTGGKHTNFTLELTREDGDQNLDGLTVSAPPGFTATLRGVAYCPEPAIATATAPGYSGLAEQAASACPASSQVGSVIASGGAGSRPLYVRGRAFLAGPYRGAPLSLLVVIPAVSGPYDLGDISVRVALRVDPETAQVTAISDPLPQIVEGIPVRTRSIRIEFDRPDFILNPTNCDPLAVRATVSGSEGAQASLEQPFQVANCATLPFGPKLSLKLNGGVNRLGHPAIHAVLKTAPGEANVGGVTVTLPQGELLDNSHIKTVCSRVAFSAEQCPPGSRLGNATATSPLLDAPLSGPIYLRSSGKGLPDLALDLHGQVHVVAVARVDTVHSAYRVTFKSVPDVPLGDVTVNLAGGGKGLLQNSEPLCGHHKRATVKTVGQNGMVAKTKVPLGVSCGKSARPHGSHRGNSGQTTKGARR